MNRLGSTWVNISNLWPELWDYNNPIENKLKQIIKSNSQSTQYWRIKLKKKSIKKEPKKVIQVSNLWLGSWNQDNLLEKNKKKNDLMGVKIPRLVNLIIRPRYPHRKQIKIDYEA